MLNFNRKDWTSLPSLKYLVRVRLLLLSPSLGGLVLPSPLSEFPVHFPWYSRLWWTNWHLPLRCSLHQQYYFPSLYLFPNPPFGSSSIQGGRSLMYAGSPLVVSLLEVLDLSDDFLGSSAIF